MGATAFVAAVPTYGATATTQTSTTQPAKKLSAEDIAQISNGFAKYGVHIAKWNGIIGDGSVLRDPAKYSELRAKLVPLDLFMTKMQLQEQLVRVVAGSTVYTPESAANRLAFEIANSIMRQSVLVAIEDEDATVEANEELASADKRIQFLAKLKFAAAQWLVAPDEAAASNAADKIEALLKSIDVNDEKNRPCCAGVIGLLRYHGVTEAAEKSLRSMIVANCPDKFVLRVAAMIEKQKAGVAAIAVVTDKPMIIKGTTVDGSAFSTEQYKGKVVLVDFWASWCGPCKAELPHVKEMYKKYHDQGLEIVAVSNDYTKDALTKYLAGDPEMVWPNLFDPTAAADHEWNSISKQYHINSIPQMFLIDRNGVCRTVEARENMDAMIPKLLAESPKVVAAN
jgi:thiol-disulfide isomerase/thioredoxin